MQRIFLLVASLCVSAFAQEPATFSIGVSNLKKAYWDGDFKKHEQDLNVCCTGVYAMEVNGGDIYRITFQSPWLQKHKFEHCDKHLLNTEVVHDFLLRMESIISNDIGVTAAQGKAVCHTNKVKLLLNRSSDLKQRHISRAEFAQVAVPCP